MTRRFPVGRGALPLGSLLGSLLGCLLATACESGGRPGTVPAPSPVTEAVPAPFEGRVNPLPASPDSVERGRELFRKSCAMCHGEGADGKGPSALGLDPPPANFQDGARLARYGDDYLFWRITTGKPGTAMPAFGPTLSDAERWAILRYLRTIPGAQRADELPP